MPTATNKPEAKRSARALHLTKLVHIGKSKLAMDEDTYRAVLEETTGKRSCLAMAEPELELVLARMKGLGFKRTVGKGDKRVARRKEKLWKKIAAVWFALHQANVVENSSKPAMQKWCVACARGKKAEWLTEAQLSACIEALKQWAMRTDVTLRD